MGESKKEQIHRIKNGVAFQSDKLHDYICDLHGEILSVAGFLLRSLQVRFATFNKRSPLHSEFSSIQFNSFMLILPLILHCYIPRKKLVKKRRKRKAKEKIKRDIHRGQKLLALYKNIIGLHRLMLYMFRTNLVVRNM